VKTRFTELVGCEVPLQLAAMGGIGTTELAAAVVDAGGCGMVPNGTEPAGGCCGVNFLLPFEPSAQDVVEASDTARIIEFFYGEPRSEVVDAAKGAGAVAGWQVGSAAEAAAAQECGCDYVVAQGTEAGGHVRGRQSLDEVLAATLASVNVPVLAAGGIVDADRVAELIRNGADGVRVGTRFAVCDEAGTHPRYVAALLEAGEDATELTEWFGEGWENAPHRVLRSALQAARKSGWKRPLPPHAAIDREPGDMAMYAGTGVGTITSTAPAGAVVEELVAAL
jgi:NAD(P)H-dependent flavin oxidoreductase YrpB (nitropropane dioxygenase family)